MSLAPKRQDVEKKIQARGAPLCVHPGGPLSATGRTLMSLAARPIRTPVARRKPMSRFIVWAIGFHLELSVLPIHVDLELHELLHVIICNSNCMMYTLRFDDFTYDYYNRASREEVWRL